MWQALEKSENLIKSQVKVSSVYSAAVFGFLFLEEDKQTKKVYSTQDLDSPLHCPAWLPHSQEKRLKIKFALKGAVN